MRNRGVIDTISTDFNRMSNSNLLNCIKLANREYEMIEEAIKEHNKKEAISKNSEDTPIVNVQDIKDAMQAERRPFIEFDETSIDGKDISSKTIPKGKNNPEVDEPTK